MKFVIIAVLVIACGNSTKESTPTPTPTPTMPTPAPPPTPTSKLALGEAIIFEGTTPIWKLHADGRTEVFDATSKAWHDAETITADGGVTYLNQVALRITDRAITGPDGATPILMTIDGNTLTVPIREEPDGDPAQVKVELASDGQVTVHRGKPAVRWRVEAKDAAVMRTAFLAFGVTIMPRLRGR